MADTVRYRLGEQAFSWDEAKYEANLLKHGVTFEEAATTWMDPLALERLDDAHSGKEERWFRLGMSLRGVLLVVWSTERASRNAGTVIRLIGARRATARERELYEEEVDPEI